jgi:hypothetical protein
MSTTAPDAGQPQSTIALWNPNAAANWSILFSPAFGAYLHMLNWRALGDEQKAKAARTWFWLSIGVLLASLVIALFFDNDAIMRAVGLGLLLSWYFSAAKSQVKYIKDQCGKNYIHRGWSKPLLIAIGCLVGYFVLAVVVGVIAGVARG